MRFAWYAGASTALAASVVVSAFHQRANFYSAMVYLAQSNFCLIALINFIYLIYGTSMFGLQRLLYGSLRQVEVEQLSEKAWFAITETCLAMTIFRDEIGAWFLVMFTALITGKVWGWIGDGRVEILEQQPPANPSLFHTRLSISLLISISYDVWLLRYAIKCVIQQARPDMMVMFLFEFAVLATSSARTGIRYLVSVIEHRIIKDQTKLRLEERRREVRQQREDMLRQREQNPAEDISDQPELPREEDVDEMDIEVPGWESKGQWILILDLIADCTKLSIYIVFFFILFSFYGLPIHIMRDLFLTGRAVIKRGTALWKYRKAIEDMNKYPDATSEDITREDTCIICREEMRPWDPADEGRVLQRVRPKKLPCGHILHMGCLKSWLERQQVCPTCRRSVVISDAAPAPNREAVLQRMGLGGFGAPAAPAQQGQQPANGQGQAPQAGPRPGPGREGPRPRVFDFGGLRVGFAQGGENIQELAQRMAVPRPPAAMPAGQAAPTPTPSHPPPSTGPDSSNGAAGMRDQLSQMERNVRVQTQALQLDQQQLQVMNLLLAELDRLRQQQQQQTQQTAEQQPTSTSALPYPGLPSQQSLPPLPSLGSGPLHHASRTNGPTLARFGVNRNTSTIPSGSQDLPEGVILPPGWSLMPLQRLDGGPVHQSHLEITASGSTSSGSRMRSSSPLHHATDLAAGSSGAASDFPTASNAEGRQASQSQVGASDSVADDAAPTTAQPVSSGHQPEIIAPNPVMPSWGGANQLFGSSNERSQEDGHSRSRDPSVATEQQLGANLESVQATDSTSTQPSADNEGGIKAKGKAKAVTVEDEDEAAGEGG